MFFLFPMPVGLALFLLGCWYLHHRYKPSPPHKVCPACAETVKPAALLCRHCGTDLTHEPVLPPAPVPPLPPTFNRNAFRSEGEQASADALDRIRAETPLLKGTSQLLPRRPNT